jgi:CRISPR-associated endonuclease/helicase Cas3
MEFPEFFKKATGRIPYPYQERLATDDPLPDLLDIPTGLGKTSAAVLAWLWRRRFAPEGIRIRTPRRLVYCLPMRVLVEQTRDNARNWLRDLAFQDEIRVHVLMGGEQTDEWEMYPEREAILIGTQDMLLSRALNRGYGMSRYRWPVHFGLLNSDCMWVMDETQLMGVGVETSAQLDAFRRRIFGAREPALSLWMSATLGKRQLETVDHAKPPCGWSIRTLGQDDNARADVQQRVRARKSVKKLPIVLSNNTARVFPKVLAEAVLKSHQHGTLTLVVINRVNRAQEVYTQLLRLGCAHSHTALVHSRFREPDRGRHEQILCGQGDRIVVATQAVEAGVDVSARTLFTELAPWSSLVQRFGRCNRYGEFDEGAVFLLDIQTENEEDALALPYLRRDLEEARAALEKVADAAPLHLPVIETPQVVRPVLRRKDLLDLFDTTPDLCGNDLDVSRYIRDGQDTDVQVFWRDVDDDGPTNQTPLASRQELCSVSVGRIRDFLKTKQPRAWRWNPLEARWEPVKQPRPGQLYLIERDSGGYSDKLGWTGETADIPTLISAETPGIPEAADTDRPTFIGRQVDLTTHLSHVSEQACRLACSLSLAENQTELLTTAARWHDVGKAHPVFQDMLRHSDAALTADTLWAKSASTQGRYCRKGFRHELASALVWLQLVGCDRDHRDLIAYLIAAHHGRVRLSIRSWPNETEPPDPNVLFARGIWQGDEIPGVNLGDGATAPPVTLDMSIMRLGDGTQGESWLARMLRLRDDSEIGPFRLALYETLLRIADFRASAQEQQAP